MSEYRLTGNSISVSLLRENDDRHTGGTLQEGKNPCGGATVDAEGIGACRAGAGIGVNPQSGGIRSLPLGKPEAPSGV